MRPLSEPATTLLVVTVDAGAVIAEIDAVLARCGVSRDNPSVRIDLNAPGAMGQASPAGNRGLIASSCLACIERNAPNQSYVQQAQAIASDPRLTRTSLDALVGILVSIREDIEAGYGQTLEQRVRAAVLDDLLEVAREIEELHAAPAIVLAVSVLEEHVRELAEANGVETLKLNGRFRSFEEMTADLKNEGVLLLPEYRQAGGWYAQRTEAAHGRFANVTPEEAPRIIAGVRDFIVRHPA